MEREKKTSEAQKKATIKYIRKKKDKITILADKGKKDLWRSYAKREGKSLNRWVLDVIGEWVARHEL